MRHRDRVPRVPQQPGAPRTDRVLRSKPSRIRSRYQVLEAQPEVLGAIKSATRAKTVHRSLRLTPFGEDFCAVCLPVDPAEIERLGEP